MKNFGLSQALICQDNVIPLKNSNAANPGDQLDPILEESTAAHTLISATSIGLVNRGRLLRALIDDGPSSRADLARLTGVSRGTIGGIVQPLINQQIVEEGETIPPNHAGGKPAVKLRFSRNTKPICAVYLKGNLVQSCLMSLGGEVFAYRQAALDRHGTTTGEALEVIQAITQQTLNASPVAVLGIGVAVERNMGIQIKPGAVSQPTDLLESFLKTTLARVFDNRICVAQYGQALLLGERWFGAGRGERNFAVIDTGEVLAAAHFSEGYPTFGSAHDLSLIGHTTVQTGAFACECGRTGCWNTIATLAWVRRQALERGLENPTKVDAELLTHLSEQGNVVADGLLRDYAYNLSLGLANLQKHLAVNAIVLRGDVAKAGNRLRDLIVESLAASGWSGKKARLVLSADNELVGLRGAAALVLSDFLALQV